MRILLSLVDCYTGSITIIISGIVGVALTVLRQRWLRRRGLAEHLVAALRVDELTRVALMLVIPVP